MKALKYVGVILVGLVIAGVLGARSLRGKFEPPVTIKPGIAQVEAGGALVVGARVGAKVVLFDAGMDEQGRAVDALLAHLKASRADVSDIFITHGHPDHIAAVPLFPKARIHAGAADAGWLAGTETPSMLLPRFFALVMPQVTAPLTDPLSGVAEVVVGEVAATEGAAPEKKVVRCLPTPGHTAGSYVYLYDGVLIAGDVMRLSEGELTALPRPVDANREQNRQAVKALKPLLEKAVVDFVSTAHGGTTPAGQGRRMLDAHFASLGA
jgi:glyoxylase-like metal-dependent hydrolase (beta-lactamase superfamily II)